MPRTLSLVILLILPLCASASPVIGALASFAAGGALGAAPIAAGFMAVISMADSSPLYPGQ